MTWTIESLQVNVQKTREDLGRAAARDAARYLKELGKTKDRIHLLFAAAPSQREFLSILSEDSDIPWEKVTAFHMDEYLGLPSGHPNTFGIYLTTEIFSKVPLGEVHLLNGEADPVEECLRYGELLRKHPLDAVFLGIGENGHLAFNDPPVADFEDPDLVKIIRLDERSRGQQVNDGCFAAIGEVPEKALTLTIPALLSGKRIYCMVPGPTKAEAVADTLIGPIKENCPASILRTCAHAVLYLDEESSKLYMEKKEIR